MARDNMRVSCRFFGIREFKVRRERDTGLLLRTGHGIGDFDERDSGNDRLNEPRTGISVDENL